MNFNFGEVLSRALQITWRHKMLWSGGIVITLFSFIVGFLPNFFLNPFFMPGSMEDLARIEQEPWLFALIMGATFLMVIIMIPLSVIALTIPVAGTLRAERQADLGFGEVLRDSTRYFWRVLGLFFLIGLVIFTLVTVVMFFMVLVNVISFGFGMFCVLPLYCVLLLAMMLVYAYAIQGQVAVLADDLGVVDALKRSWEIVKNNFWGILLLSVVIYFGLWLISTIITVPLMIPMYMNMFRMMDSIESFEAMQMDLMRTMSIWMLIYAPIYSIVQGISITFMQSAWTVAYLKITRNPEINVPPEAPVFAEPNA
jgi:hypothetical protein